MDKKILYDTWAFIALIAAYIQKSPLIITLRILLNKTLSECQEHKNMATRILAANG
jgi:hypothetical protein